jgi:hypothetical protein
MGTFLLSWLRTNAPSYRISSGIVNLLEHHLRLTRAHTTRAKKLGLSRQWVGELVQRLDAAGWLVPVSPTLPDGTNGSTMFMIGRQLKRVLIMLTKSKRGKSPTKPAAKCRWHFSPSPKEKKEILIRQAENAPPKPEHLAKIPLLRLWMKRGEGQ